MKDETGVKVKEVKDGRVYITIECADRRWAYNSWAKRITDVGEENTGYALKGDFLPMAKGKNKIHKEIECKKGDIILVVQDIGSRQYHRQYAFLSEFADTHIHIHR